MTATFDSASEFVCPADDCDFTVRSDDVDDVVEQAREHADRGHGERLERKTVLWQMRAGRPEP